MKKIVVFKFEVFDESIKQIATEVAREFPGVTSVVNVEGEGQLEVRGEFSTFELTRELKKINESVETFKIGTDGVTEPQVKIQQQDEGKRPINIEEASKPSNDDASSSNGTEPQAYGWWDQAKAIGAGAAEQAKVIGAGAAGKAIDIGVGAAGKAIDIGVGAAGGVYGYLERRKMQEKVRRRNEWLKEEDMNQKKIWQEKEKEKMRKQGLAKKEEEMKQKKILEERNRILQEKEKKRKQDLARKEEEMKQKKIWQEKEKEKEKEKKRKQDLARKEEEMKQKKIWQEKEKEKMRKQGLANHPGGTTQGSTATSNTVSWWDTIRPTIFTGEPSGFTQTLRTGQTSAYTQDYRREEKENKESAAKKGKNGN
ncbi:unnamed protein product [Thlaspi arvense]|uniref:HMA domain-containing protein n=1 Tax=Thlaspi arvense TaxID=13288 RepID=A0AAU9SQ57_THLAR|nr:unnamed protein product [Thlaspi arvense]